MRLGKATLFVISISAANAFAPSELHVYSASTCCRTKRGSILFSTLVRPPTERKEEEPLYEPSEQSIKKGPLSGEEINIRLARQLEKLRLKDKTSIRLGKEDLKVVYEDKDIIVLDKPSGVLTVAGRDKSNNSLAQAVYDNLASQEKKLADADRMVVHRLGMDTSGLIIMAKTLDAVRGMNSLFRTRSVERTYTALVCGHVQKKRGYIDLPLMRDYKCPPFQRISTDEHQEALVDLDPQVVGKKILEQPKPALTRYEVLGREELNGAPVTRVKLTSISGRTHQLNCHLAAMGHPIVGDRVYGESGDAASNGGLTDDELVYMIPNAARASLEDQRVANAAVSTTACHAAYVRFQHPVTKQEIKLSSDSPF